MFVAGTFESTDDKTHVLELYLPMEDGVELDEPAPWCGGSACSFILKWSDNSKSVDIIFTPRHGPFGISHRVSYVPHNSFS